MADVSPNSPQQRTLTTDVATRTECLLLAVLTIIGLLLRVVPVGGLAIEHFDEGVYASNLLFPDGGYAYPARHLYAPPLLPNLIEWSIMLGGNARWVPLLPGIILGTASIPILWWLSRRWFGAPAAIAAACVLALSDFHVAFSRSALTDVPLVFFLMLAVGALQRGLGSEPHDDPFNREPLASASRGVDADLSAHVPQKVAAKRVSFGYCLLGGLAAGLAWATKYNGWLTLAIGGSGTFAALVVSRIGWFARNEVARQGLLEDADSCSSSEDSLRAPQVKQIALGLGVAVVTAALVWSPVYFGLQEHGGYVAVAKNHRQYVHGWAEWLPALRRHQAIQKHFAGPVTLLGVMLAPWLATLVVRAARSTGNVRGDSESRAEVVNEADRSPWNGEADCGRVAPQLAGELRSGSPTMSTLLMTSWLTSAVVLDPVVVFVVWPLIDWLTRVLEFRHRERAADWSQWLGLWMSLAWIIGLTLATPFYRPYPRLLLPFCIAGYIGVSSAMVRLLTGTLGPRKLNPKYPLRRRMALTIGVLVCLMSISLTSRKGFVGAMPRNELADVAIRALAAIREDNKVGPSIEGIRQLVYVYAEPALLFHLSSDDCLVGPVTNLSFARRAQHGNDKLPVYVIAGPHAFVSETFDRQFKEAREFLLPVATLRYRPSDFVLLDEFAPAELPQARQQRLQIFRVK